MEAKLKSQDKILRDDWNALLRRSPQGSFYALTYYMDVIASDWMGIEVLEDNELVAVMPLLVRKKYGMQYSLQPNFVQYWGVFFDNLNFQDSYRELSWKRKVVKLIVDQIPEKLKLFGYGMAPNFDYAFPFHWAGYDLKTRYSYHIDLTKGEEEVWKGIKRKKKNLLRQAERDLGAVQRMENPEGLLGIIKSNLDVQQGIMSQGHLDTLPQLITELRDEGYVLQVNGPDGKPQAAGYFVDFEGKTTYLVGAKMPGNIDNGAPGLILWDAIRRSFGKSQIFDFEGSMLEGVESFFRTFGGRPIPYLFIEKNDLPLLIRWIRKSR